MAKLLNGKKLSERILTNLKKEVKKHRSKLRLAVILIGENPVSQVFINQKKKACEKVGVAFELFKFPTQIKKNKLKKEIEKIVGDKANSGVIIQLPLPKKFIPEEILNLIPAEKDIDVLSEDSFSRFCQGKLTILPPVVGAISKIFNEYKIFVKGKNVVVLGSGRLVGLPLTIWLLREKATVSVLNEFTKDISFFTKKADILISGVGKPSLIKEDMVKKGVIVIDVGISIKKGKLVGDVDFKSVSKKASYITPVPGGIGPLTITCLLENLIKINK